jgi:hypothetical protein
MKNAKRRLMNAITEEIEKIRSARRRISTACGNDPYRLVARYSSRAKNAGKDYRTTPPAGYTAKVNETPTT